MMTERMFPMQDGPAIPWSVAEKVYVLYSGIYGTQQSLERLAERGGFGWAEIPLFAEDFRKRFGSVAYRESMQ